MERVALLRALPELGGCSDIELAQLAAQADEVVVAAHRRLAGEGDPCRQYLVVIDGQLRATSDEAGGRILGTGQSFGWSAMWERTPSAESLETESEARLLVMGHAQFRAAKALTTPPANC